MTEGGPYTGSGSLRNGDRSEKAGGKLGILVSPSPHGPNSGHGSPHCGQRPRPQKTRDSKTVNGKANVEGTSTFHRRCGQDTHLVPDPTGTVFLEWRFETRRGGWGQRPVQIYCVRVTTITMADAVKIAVDDSGTVHTSSDDSRRTRKGVAQGTCRGPPRGQGETCILGQNTCVGGTTDRRFTVDPDGTSHPPSRISTKEGRS